MKGPRESQRARHKVPTLWEEDHGAEVLKDHGYFPSFSKDSDQPIPEDLCREDIPKFPNLSEMEVVRHFTRISELNFGIDHGFYPLGSCTMKYNPKVNEKVAAEEGFNRLHPLVGEKHSQGALEVMYKLQEALMAITGMKGCTLHPAAGAHGELVGVKMINAYHRHKGNKTRNVILIPDSAHGTNPASAALSNLKVKTVKSNDKGMIDLDELDKVMDENVAALMITVPNTLGIYEEHIVEISKLVHDRGGLVYCDGANLNAVVGKVNIAAMGVDCMHINLHKTFSTPHGGGGPGAGPVVVSEKLLDYLPVPVVRFRDGIYSLDHFVPRSVGRFRAFHGNFGMLVRALCYIYAFGKEHIAEISEGAVLNANYVKAKLKKHFHLPYDSPTLHEAVFTDKIQMKENEVSTLDIAKRLMDFGIHPPTIYFPLVVRGALMIEPTESESKGTLDYFVETMAHIAKEAKDAPKKVKEAPHRLGVGRFDETTAAREPVLTWNKKNS